MNKVHLVLGGASMMTAAADKSECESKKQTAKEPDVTVRIDPADHSTFNDTNGDGLGEFEGWGTSLCWWANAVGYDDTLAQKACDLFFGPNGLNMNIGRYNIGGGDNITDPNGVFYHAPHIVRSDSGVPGYCVDVTPIASAAEAAGFAQWDEELGYAWNYDWDADKNQMNVLTRAIKAHGAGFLTEAFSNSAPWFMTKSGCSSGAAETDNPDDRDNLPPKSYKAFAKYMADVMEHFAGQINWQSVSPLNEPNPANSYWKQNSNKQEGCHVAVGEAQSAVIMAVYDELKSRGINVVHSATDETSIDLAITSYNALSSDVKDIVGRIDTHTYGGSKRQEMRSLAESEGKNLWMSEVDGSFTAGEDAGEMSAALGIGERVIDDVRTMKCSAWIFWNLIDSHYGTNRKSRDWPNSGNDYDSRTDLLKRVNLNRGIWGIAFANHDDKDIDLTMKYYGFGQFSRYITPGMTIVGSDGDTLAAYDSKNKKLVVVALNTKTTQQIMRLDLSQFAKVGNITSITRTSGDMASGEKWQDVTKEQKKQNNKSARDVMLKGNSITTIVISGVTYKVPPSSR